MSESDNEYASSKYLTINYRQVIDQTEEVAVEEEKCDNIHSATKLVLKKSSANNGKEAYLKLQSWSWIPSNRSGERIERSLQGPW